MCLTETNTKICWFGTLEFCRLEKGIEIFAWCIMSNHVHLIARATAADKLQDILRDFKKFTSKAIINAIK
jgi:REP element-mobilizing transposase RayT